MRRKVNVMIFKTLSKIPENKHLGSATALTTTNIVTTNKRASTIYIHVKLRMTMRDNVKIVVLLKLSKDNFIRFDSLIKII